MNYTPIPTPIPTTPRSPGNRVVLPRPKTVILSLSLWLPELSRAAEGWGTRTYLSVWCGSHHTATKGLCSLSRPSETLIKTIILYNTRISRGNSVVYCFFYRQTHSYDAGVENTEVMCCSTTSSWGGPTRALDTTVFPNPNRKCGAIQYRSCPRQD